VSAPGAERFLAEAVVVGTVVGMVGWGVCSSFCLVAPGLEPLVTRPPAGVLVVAFLAEPIQILN